MKNSYRLAIENMLERGDLQGLLRKAGELHGHLCNYLTFGVMAGFYGMRRLGVANTGMEEIVAVVETNNCFSDGVQLTTGCTFGNNALVFRDYGKTAVTLSRRNGQAVRMALNPDYDDSREAAFPEAYGLFNKLVARREPGTPADYGRMMQLFEAMSLQELSVPPERMFLIAETALDLPAYAPIFQSHRCDACHENVMQSRIVDKAGRKLCRACAREAYLELNGSGILQAKAGEAVGA